MQDAAERGRADWFVALPDDDQMFRAWYDTALPKVLGFVHARCGDRKLAEDLTQEAFVDAIRGRSRFDGRADPVTWVCAIAGRRLADHWRRVARDERRRIRLVHAREDPPEVVAWSIADDRDALFRALGTLPAIQRAALVLHYLDDLPVSEVAASLDRSPHAVESLLARGRESLRVALADQGGES